MPWIDGKFCETVDEANGVYREVRPLVRNIKDGSVLVLVPGGEFEMGYGKDNDCTKHQVQMAPFYIGIYCVTNRQYAGFVTATKRKVEGGRWKFEAGKESHPVVNVSWDDATAYAQWAGCALPTEAQWEKAVRGLKGLIYPWGNDWDETKCRNHMNKGSEDTAAVWKYAAGASGYGTYQQSGNIWEWCADWCDKDYYGKSEKRNPTGPVMGSCRVSRGGSWRGTSVSGFRGTYRNDDGPALCLDNLGFRLVRTV